MRVLVACEESQAVCKAFRELGHEAYSCDIQECSGGHPEWHIQGDVLEILNPKEHPQAAGTWHGGYERYSVSGIMFATCDRKAHWVERWDLIVAHPPCTYLTSAGSIRLFNRDHTIKDHERYRKGLQAAEFFNAFLNANCPRIAVENPIPMKIFGLPKYNQIIEPFMFGDPWRKRTCLWLKGLPILFSTDIVEPKGLWVGSTSARRDPSVKQRYELRTARDPKERSKTFPGIAKAMAEQWGGLCER